MSSDIDDIIGMSNDKSLTKKALMKALEDDEGGGRKRKKEGKRKRKDDEDEDEDEDEEDEGEDEKGDVKEVDVEVGTKKPAKKVNKRRLGRALHNNKLNQIRISMPYQVPMWNDPKVTPMGTTPMMYGEMEGEKEESERDRKKRVRWDVIVMVVLAVIVIVCCGYALWQMVRTVMMQKKDPIGDDLRRDVSKLSEERRMSELIDREKVKEYVREEVPRKDVDADMYRAAWGDEVDKNYERMSVGMKGGRRSYERSKPMPMRDAKGRFVKMR